MDAKKAESDYWNSVALMHGGSLHLNNCMIANGYPFFEVLNSGDCRDPRILSGVRGKNHYPPPIVLKLNCWVLHSIKSNDGLSCFPAERQKVTTVCSKNHPAHRIAEFPFQTSITVTIPLPELPSVVSRLPVFLWTDGRQSGSVLHAR